MYILGVLFLFGLFVIAVPIVNSVVNTSTVRSLHASSAYTVENTETVKVQSDVYRR